MKSCCRNVCLSLSVFGLVEVRGSEPREVSDDHWEYGGPTWTKMLYTEQTVRGSTRGKTTRKKNTIFSLERFKKQLMWHLELTSTLNSTNQEKRSVMSRFSAERSQTQNQDQNTPNQGCPKWVLEKWDPNLKLVAESYAAKCIWNHNPALDDTGENLFVSSGPLDLRDALEKWFLEHLDFDYQNNSCDEDKMCGHYTQMVWADTHRVGCAFHLCNTMEGLDLERASFLVCNYFPAGNYEDQRPYVEGDWCSSCPENLQECENNLCGRKCSDRFCLDPNPLVSSSLLFINFLVFS
uniref:SCP domain-containing protein n=1 Tax=Poecilia latipinna TaxID=48699 RepID=A0A3B3V8K6_9TELE